MEHKIFAASYWEYLLLFGDYRTAYTDLMAKNVTDGVHKDSRLYVLLAEGKYPGGFLFLDQEHESLRIVHVFVLPKWRGRGLGRALLQHVLDSTRRDLVISLNERTESFDIMAHLVETMGFGREFSALTYRIELYRWQRFMEEKGIYLERVLLRQGYRTYSFREADARLLDLLYHSQENEFGNILDVRPYFDRKAKCLDEDMSFIGVLPGEDGEELAAYSLVSRLDSRTAIFEQMAAAEKYKNTGNVMLPIIRSVEVFSAKGLNRAAYTMYENNQNAHALRRKILDQLTVYVQHTYHYMLKQSQ